MEEGGTEGGRKPIIRWTAADADRCRQAGRRGREVAQLEDSTIICIECQAKASKRNYKSPIGSINDETSLAIEQKNPSPVCIGIVAGQTK